MTLDTDHAAKAWLANHTTPEQAEKIMAMSQKPVIIGGCGRSGTTLLLSLLSSHPRIHCIPQETMALCPDAFSGIEYKKNPDLNMPFETRKVFEHLLQGEIPGECTRWCEKTPRNVLYFERILAYFGPHARLIHIVRDGRDVVTSRHPMAPDRFWVSPTRWIQDVGAGVKFENHPQVFTIRYEDLLREYESNMRRICDFIEEEFHPNLLKYPETAKVRENRAWRDQVRAIDSNAVGRGQKPEYAEQISTLLGEPQAVALLKHYDYELE